MLSKLRLIIILFISYSANSQFIVEGKILDKENIENLEIFVDVGMGFNKKFPAKIENTKFYISGELSEPINSMLVISNDGERRSFKILLDNKSTYHTNVLLKDNPEILGEKWYSINTNSQFHNAWRNFYDNQSELYSQKKKVEHSFENGEISKNELDRKFLSLNAEINKEYKNLAIEKPSNFSTPYIITGAPDLSSEYLMYYQMLDKKVQESYWGVRLKETLDIFASKNHKREKENTPILGSTIPDIEGENTSGKSKQFSNKNMESQLTIIDFWASWCIPCRKENSKLGELNSTYSDDELKIISFSLDSNKKSWKKASSDDDIRWENISDLQGMKSSTIKDFQIGELPRNLLIDSDGKVIAVNKFGDDLKEFVETFFNS